MNTKILIILAEGFEESEAIIPADVLRRLDFDLIIAGLDSKTVLGAHNIPVETDCLLSEVNISEITMVILPGGMPGSTNLRESDTVMEIVKTVYSGGGFATAICAAPIALGKAGIINGKKVTAYPGFETMLEGADYTGNRTERDGNIITGKGPGAAFEFAAEIAKALGKEEDVNTLFGNMFVKI